MENLILVWQYVMALRINDWSESGNGFPRSRDAAQGGLLHKGRPVSGELIGALGVHQTAD